MGKAHAGSEYCRTPLRKPKCPSYQRQGTPPTSEDDTPPNSEDYASTTSDYDSACSDHPEKETAQWDSSGVDSKSRCSSRDSCSETDSDTDQATSEATHAMEPRDHPSGESGATADTHNGTPRSSSDGPPQHEVHDPFPPGGNRSAPPRLSDLLAAKLRSTWERRNENDCDCKSDCSDNVPMTFLEL